MDRVTKIHEISLRIDHLQQAGDWIARTLVNTDGACSQTGSLISVLAEDVRQRLLELVTELETEVFIKNRETYN